MKITNEDKAKIFNEWLGTRFKTFEIASEGAPISFLCKDHEDKEYYIHVQIAEERSIISREHTGIMIENAHFYHLYSMMSQDMNVFWYEAFEDGYILFYLNDCLTPEQLNVLTEQTLIGVASALHIEKPEIRHNTDDGKGYYTVNTNIWGSPFFIAEIFSSTSSLNSKHFGDASVHSSSPNHSVLPFLLVLCEYGKPADVDLDIPPIESRSGTPETASSNDNTVNFSFDGGSISR